MKRISSDEHGALPWLAIIPAAIFAYGAFDAAFDGQLLLMALALTAASLNLAFGLKLWRQRHRMRSGGSNGQTDNA